MDTGNWSNSKSKAVTRNLDPIAVHRETHSGINLLEGEVGIGAEAKENQGKGAAVEEAVNPAENPGRGTRKTAAGQN